MFTIKLKYNFIKFLSSIITSIIEIEQTVGFIRKAFHFKISRQDKIKHSELGQEHLIKTIKHSWRFGAKIMKQSKQVLKKKYCQKLLRRKEGRDFFSALTRKIDTGLPALVVALCSNRSKCSDRNRMPCKRS